MRDISLDRRYLIPIMLGVIALGGAGYAVGSTVGSSSATTVAVVKTITITHEIHLTPNSPTRVKTIREAAKVKTIHSPVTTVRSRQVLAAPAQVNALTSVRTITVPRTLTATTTEVSTVVSVTTVTETTKKPHPTHP